jgi:predicted TIM-barrel fold metal-dependent hydrolase
VLALRSRSRNRLRWPAFLVLSLTACSGSAQLQAPQIVPRVDHHQHLLSPALAQVWSAPESVLADRLIAQLDAAGIRRALVLSLAYAYGSPDLTLEDEYERVKAENDWTSEQVARFPDRLLGFCSVNPLKNYALEEVDRCSKIASLRHGLKLHFANSGVNLRNPDHVVLARRVFQAANSRRMAIVAHVWTGDDKIRNQFGKAEAMTVVNEILPSAPDVPIQIAHLGGSGPRLDPGTMDAMVLLAEAVAKSGSRTRNVYFDIATNVTARSSATDAAFVAARIRQIGLSRILYGSDMATGGNATAQDSWKAHRDKLALSDAEFRAIANNIAPYMQD